MIIASWNVNSLAVRLPQLLNWLQLNRPNVMCIQETKLVDLKFPVAEIEDLGYHCEFYGEKAYNGVAVLTDVTPDAVQKGFTVDDETSAKRFLEVQLGSVTVINVYVPNGSEVGSEKFSYKLKWLEMLRCHLDERHNKSENLVICGDFNIAPEDRDVYSVEAMTGHIHFTDAEHAALKTLSDWGLTDTFRLHTQEGGHYSWWDYRVGAFRRNLGLRIDQIWATKPMADVCARAWISKETRKNERPSDHVPIAAEFNL